MMLLHQFQILHKDLDMISLREAHHNLQIMVSLQVIKNSLQVIMDIPQTINNLQIINYLHSISQHHLGLNIQVTKIPLTKMMMLLSTVLLFPKE